MGLAPAGQGLPSCPTSRCLITALILLHFSTFSSASSLNDTSLDLRILLNSRATSAALRFKASSSAHILFAPAAGDSTFRVPATQERFRTTFRTNPLEPSLARSSSLILSVQRSPAILFVDSFDSFCYLFFTAIRWKGSLYPLGCTLGTIQSFYAEHFDSVEVDPTFYACPSVHTISGWFRKTPDNFSSKDSFALHSQQLPSHSERLPR